MLAKASKLFAELRKNDVKLAVDLTGRKIGDQIKVAQKKGIENVLIIGSKELDSARYTLKNLVTGVENSYSVGEISALFK